MPPYHTWNHEYFAVYRVGYGGTKPEQAEEILVISEAKSQKPQGVWLGAYAIACLYRYVYSLP
jgi:hypothetical protein